MDLDRDLLNRIERAVQPGQVILTLSHKRPNRIVEIGIQGVMVQTGHSDEQGNDPQLVPAWMIDAAWQRLSRFGEISGVEVREDLNIKRSAFVLALLAQFAEVKVVADRPIRLRLATPGDPRDLV